MVATWDDSDEESSDEEDSQEVSNLTLMAIRDDDELDEVNDLSSYDELMICMILLKNCMMIGYELVKRMHALKRKCKNLQ